MGLFDFLRPKPPSGTGAALPRVSVDQIFAVPLAARKLDMTGVNPREKYVFYSFLFADSADAAVVRLRRELHDDGLEFIELTGQVLPTTIAEWPDFVNKQFGLFKDSLPTAKQIAEDSRGIVYYSPKIIQY